MNPDIQLLTVLINYAEMRQLHRQADKLKALQAAIAEPMNPPDNLIRVVHDGHSARRHIVGLINARLRDAGMKLLAYEEESA
ncbi:MAG: hypothetical protein ACPG7F_00820 [Aggregatilineales bacterium]